MASENKHKHLSICKEISLYLLINQVYNNIPDIISANKPIHLSIINHLARPLPNGQPIICFCMHRCSTRWVWHIASKQPKLKYNIAKLIWMEFCVTWKEKEKTNLCSRCINVIMNLPRISLNFDQIYVHVAFSM